MYLKLYTKLYKKKKKRGGGGGGGVGHGPPLSKLRSASVGG